MNVAEASTQLSERLLKVEAARHAAEAVPRGVRTGAGNADLL